MRSCILVVTALVLIAASVTVAPAGTDPASKCTDAKAKAAGKKAAALLKAIGKNVKKSDPIRLSADVSKAQSKLTKSFLKAELKGGCTTTGDAAAIEAKTDAFVADVSAAFLGGTTTTTTSTTTTTTTTAPPTTTTTTTSTTTTVATTSTTSTTTSTTTTTTIAGCNCCGVASYLTFDTTTPSGSCGTLRNFRCSNNSGAACSTDLDCDEGPCGSQFAGYCGDLSPLIACTTDADCMGTCGEVVALNLPADLSCDGLHSGGGGTTRGVAPLTGVAVAGVTSCNSLTGELTLGPTTAAETGSNSTCTSAGCLFGAPTPWAIPSTPPTSTCMVQTLTQDATGTGTCEGAIDIALSYDMEVFLTGDLFQMTTPPDIPGVQPCPLCVRQCGGGSADGFPCADDSECPGGTCGARDCLGGPNDGMPCTPGTPDSATLGDTEGAFPTSHDCPPSPLSIFGTLPLDFAFTTGTVVQNAADLGGGSGQQRVFCGFCRDVFNGLSLCFEGDTSGSCPAAIPPAAGSAVPCNTDADCQTDTDTYESCAQRTSGAFAEAAATQMTLDGTAAGECMDDEAFRHAVTLVSPTCMPPFFEATGDAAADYPGPGALLLQGTAQLSATIAGPTSPLYCSDAFDCDTIIGSTSNCADSSDCAPGDLCIEIPGAPGLFNCCGTCGGSSLPPATYATCSGVPGDDCDGCSFGCTEIAPGYCGDGVVLLPGESCEPPGAAAGGNGNLCRSDCTVCGDGTLNGDELCDDGNGVNGDGCDNTCTPSP